MIDYVHDPVVCPEWEDPGESFTPLKTEKILESIGRSPEEISWILEEQEAFEKEDKVFSSLKVIIRVFYRLGNRGDQLFF